ncbi:MAG TPA: MobH family relaxase [Pseudorhodoferax sp.]|nr:MobH family relaxase [Pseudorhodoferax sp.]
MANPTTEAASGLRQLGQGLRSSWARLAARLLPSAPIAPPAPQIAGVQDAPAPVQLQGSKPGWLRVLTADELLQVVQADRAMREIFRRTRLAQPVWQRDCLSAIHRYAEFVQLIPASEAHHHAHAGGLLAHTIEMLLAALTWRGGRLLPEAAPIEVIDAQRDEWTLVVFYCALLHDIAKPMTDLRVSWRTTEMTDPIRWQPMSGSLVGAAAGRLGAEYLVEFTPKSQRDYRAHSRMAMLLLPQIASPTALSFIARQPAAFEALNCYLSGEDKDSLLAKIVREADKASTRRALQSGSSARFATASAVPLVDLLMQGMRDLLRVGTELPLNRSGAAAWVFDGSIWFVAKRLADATRAWIKAQAPDEAVPGEAKNDRLFDTWQEYGCLMPNPHTGQAIWYVTVHGEAGDAAAANAAGAGRNGTGYEHSLSVLRFPLDKVFADPQHYPRAMQGRIEVQVRRGSAETAAEVGATAAADAEQGASAASAQAIGPALRGAQPEGEDAAMSRQGTAADVDARDAAAVKVKKPEAAATGAAGASGKPLGRSKPAIKSPSFNKPKPSAGASATLGASGASGQPRPDAVAVAPVPAPESVQAARPASTLGLDQAEDASMVRRRIFEELDEDYLLDPAESAPPFARTDRDGTDRARARRTMVVPAPVSSAPKGHAAAASAPLAAAPQPTALKSSPAAAPSLLLQPTTAFLVPPRPGAGGQAEPAAKPFVARPPVDAGPSAVLLKPNLPPVRGDVDTAAKPTALALHFMRWVQTSLVERSIKYNETAAVVHFVPEGMALVSPLIFKLFAEDRGEPGQSVNDYAMQVQRELIRAGWHMAGPGRTNIIRFAVLGRGGAAVGRLAAVVLVDPGRWVQPVPPSNPVLRVE